MTIDERNSVVISEHTRLVYNVPAGHRLCPGCQGKGCRECQSSGIVPDRAGRRVKVPADPNGNIAVVTEGPWPSWGTVLGRVRIDWDCKVTGAHRFAYWNLEDLEPAGKEKQQP